MTAAKRMFSERRLLSLQEAANYLDISYSTLVNDLRAGGALHGRVTPIQFHGPKLDRMELDQLIDEWTGRRKPQDNPSDYDAMVLGRSRHGFSESPLSS